MYDIFFEYRFIDSLRTCYCHELAIDIEELIIIIQKINGFEKEFRPNLIYVYKESERINWQKEIGIK